MGWVQNPQGRDGQGVAMAELGANEAKSCDGYPHPASHTCYIRSLSDLGSRTQRDEPVANY